MNTQKFIRLNTAFIPPGEVSGRAVELSKAVGELAETYFILDGVNFHPHITIYPPEYPEENILKVLAVTEELSVSLSSIRFKFKEIDSGQGYLGLAFEPSDEIQQIHEKIVNALNSLREGRIRDKYLEYHMEFDPEELQNIEKYGYPAARSLYNPHLTITRLKDENKSKEILSIIKWDISEFIVNKIGIYKMSEHGTCRELVKEFNLK